MKPITLGKFIELLETQPGQNFINFDLSMCVPSDVISYRGIYAHLAITYKAVGMIDNPCVGKFTDIMRKCLGKYFTGYKGGEFVMNNGVHIWASNYGESSGTGIIGIIGSDFQTIIQTGYCEDWDDYISIHPLSSATKGK